MSLFNIFHTYKPGSVFLYSDDLVVLDDDVLLILSTINLLDEDVLNKYKNVAYFFDDVAAPLSLYKSPKTQAFLKSVKLFFQPRREQVAKLVLDSACTFTVKYKPWVADDALDTIYTTRTKIPSIFLDIDNRPEIDSLAPSINFYKSCGDETTFYIPEVNKPDFISISKGNIIYSPHCQRNDFLNLLGSVWAYATAIKSSYEYSVLEASCLGTGLVSIDNAIVDEHKRVQGFLSFDSNSNGQTVRDFLMSIPFEEIRNEAIIKYSKKSCVSVVDDIFSFKWS